MGFSLSYRWNIFLRTLIAALGGLFVSSFLVAVVATVFPAHKALATYSGMLLSFIVWLLVALWAFTRLPQKNGFRQSMSWLHTWTGLVAGWILYFVFVTGTASYANREITRWMQPERPLESSTGLSAAEQFRRAYAVLKENPEASAASNWTVDLVGSARTSAQLAVRWSSGSAGERRGGGGQGAGPGTQGVVLDADGQLAEAAATPRQTAGGRALLRMHYALHYLPYGWAVRIVGICTLLMFAAIVTGVITHKKIFSDFFTFRPGKGQRSWLDAHNLVSVIALPFFLVITYSGLLFFLYAYMPLGVPFAYGFDAERQQAYYTELGEATGSQRLLGRMADRGGGGGRPQAGPGAPQGEGGMGPDAGRGERPDAEGEGMEARAGSAAGPSPGGESRPAPGGRNERPARGESPAGTRSRGEGRASVGGEGEGLAGGESATGTRSRGEGRSSFGGDGERPARGEFAAGDRPRGESFSPSAAESGPAPRGEDALPRESAARRGLGRQSERFVDIPAILEDVEREWGRGEIRSVSLAAGTGRDAPPTLQLAPAWGDSLRRGGNSPNLQFNALTGERIASGERPAPPASERIATAMIGLHEGLFARPVLRWLYLLAGLLGCAMIASGLVLWTVKRRPARAAGVFHFGHSLVERLNTATVAGLPFALAAYFWANRLIPATLEDRAQWEVHALFIAWALTLLYALLRPVLPGWRELLAFTAAAWLLLPVLNLSTSHRHLFAALAAGDWVLVSVEVVFVALGLVFAWAAWKVHRRILAPPPEPRRRRSRAASQEASADAASAETEAA